MGLEDGTPSDLADIIDTPLFVSNVTEMEVTDIGDNLDFFDVGADIGENLSFAMGPAGQTSPGGGVSSVFASRAVLRQAISNLSANCQKVLPSQKTLLADAKLLQMYDGRPAQSGGQTVSQIAPALSLYNPPGTLQSIVGSYNAVTLNGPGQSISNVVILGSQYFLDPPEGSNANFSLGQGTVLLHELLHYATQLSDDQFVQNYGITMQQNESGSSAISAWLQHDCKN